MTDHPTRTGKQNKALHLYCEMLAKALNDSGQDMRRTLKQEIDIPWTKESVKEHLFKPILELMTNETSTTKMDTVDPSAVYETLNRYTASKLGVSVEWPSNDILSRRKDSDLEG